ncbi:MAG: hypothetical protein ACYSU0_05525 [Planctomycetota bacterium]|jgi:hypothetical protein
MYRITLCLASLALFLTGCTSGYDQQHNASRLETSERKAAVVFEDDDVCWIARTPSARKLVSLGFAKAQDSFIYRRSMPLGEFKETFGSPRLHHLACGPFGGGAFGGWVRRTRIEGNHTILAPLGREAPPLDSSPVVDSTVVEVSVNLEHTRRPSISVGHSMLAHDSLLHLGARDITSQVTTVVNGDEPGRKWSRWYLLPDGTCLLLRLTNMTPPRGKPRTPRLEQIVLGEAGKGYGSAEDWAVQRKTTPQKLSLNKYRTELK